MSRRWRRELSRQKLRDDDDRARIERLIADAQADDTRKSAISPRDARGYEGEKKDKKRASFLFTER